MDKTAEGKKEPRKAGLMDMAKKLKNTVTGKKPESAPDNGDKPELTSDMLESLIVAAHQLGFNLVPADQGEAGGDGKGKVPMSPEAAVKLVDYLCKPKDEREPELTNLNHVQAHIFPVVQVFEEMIKPSKNGDVPDPTKIYRQAVYKHRRSVKDGWFARELADLAGLEAQEEAAKNMGVGSPLSQ